MTRLTVLEQARHRLVFLCVVLAFALLALVGPAAAEDTGVVHGTLTDNAVVKRAITDASVSIAGIPSAVDGQTYTVEGVPLGQQMLVVSAPRHVTLRRTVEVLAGDNTVDVSLGITAAETYRRYFNAYNHWKYWTAYKMVHPDVRAHYAFARYRAVMYFFTHPRYLSMRIVRTSTLATWRPEYLQKTYKDVKVIKSVRRYPWMGDIVTERGTGHWDKISGRWYSIFDWR
jgi:hypothetical protein